MRTNRKVSDVKKRSGQYDLEKNKRLRDILVTLNNLPMSQRQWAWIKKHIKKIFNYIYNIFYNSYNNEMSICNLGEILRLELKKQFPEIWDGQHRIIFMMLLYKTLTHFDLEEKVRYRLMESICYDINDSWGQRQIEKNGIIHLTEKYKCLKYFPKFILIEDTEQQALCDIMNDNVLDLNLYWRGILKNGVFTHQCKFCNTTHSTQKEKFNYKLNISRPGAIYKHLIRCKQKSKDLKNKLSMYGITDITSYTEYIQNLKRKSNLYMAYLNIGQLIRSNYMTLIKDIEPFSDFVEFDVQFNLKICRSRRGASDAFVAANSPNMGKQATYADTYKATLLQSVENEKEANLVWEKWREIPPISRKLYRGPSSMEKTLQTSYEILFHKFTGIKYHVEQCDKNTFYKIHRIIKALQTVNSAIRQSQLYKILNITSNKGHLIGVDDYCSLFYPVGYFCLKNDKKNFYKNINALTTIFIDWKMQNLVFALPQTTNKFKRKFTPEILYTDKTNLKKYMKHVEVTFKENQKKSYKDNGIPISEICDHALSSIKETQYTRQHSKPHTILSYINNKIII